MESGVARDASWRAAGPSSAVIGRPPVGVVVVRCVSSAAPSDCGRAGDGEARGEGGSDDSGTSSAAGMRSKVMCWSTDARRLARDDCGVCCPRAGGGCQPAVDLSRGRGGTG